MSRAARALVLAALLPLGTAAAATSTDVIAWVRAHPAAVSSPFVRTRPVTVYGQTRNAITTGIPCTIDVPLTVPPHGRLRAGMAVSDRLFGQSLVPRARPTRFAASFVLPDGRVEPLFERVLDIRTRPGDRRWVDVRVDLSRFAGRTGTLRLTDELAGKPRRHGKTLALWSRPVVFDAEEQRALPNLLFITIDALRAGHLASYGWHRPTSPHLDRLAAEGVRFANAFTDAPMTMPSIAQMLTATVLPTADSPNLLSALNAGGMPRTKAIIDNPYIGYWLSLGVPDTFDSITSRSWRADRITRAALAWIDAHRDDRFALYLHYLDTHTPYRTPAPFGTTFADPGYAGPVRLPFGDVDGARSGKYDARDREQIVALYDGAIRFTDEQIGLLIEGLRERGLLDRTLVVVTADHGEELWDHGSFFHGQSLYDELLHVPLLVRLPGGAHAGTVVTDQVRAIDFVPTMAQVLQVPAPFAQGRSLVPLMDGRDAGTPPLLFARAANVQFPHRFAVRSPTHKLIATVETGREELYDLAADPGERHDLAGDPAAADTLAKLRAALAALRAPLATGGYQVRAAAGDGRPHAIEVTVRGGERSLQGPDRIGLPSGDRLALSADGATLAWHGTVGAEPAGFRFDHGVAPGPGARPGLEFQVRVDGADLPPSAIHLGPDGAPAPASRFTYTRGPADLSGAEREKPPLLAPTAPPMAPGDGVQVWIWRGPDTAGTAAGGVAPAARERLRALGYVE
jgi:arylsulfatase A-like enzyme